MDTLIVKTDSFSDYFSIYTSNYGKQVFFLNEPSNELKEIDLEHRNLSQSLQFHEEHGRPIQSVYSCEKLNDTLFALTDDRATALYLANDDGMLVRTISLKSALDSFKVELYPSAPSCRTLLIADSLLILPVVPRFDRVDDFELQQVIVDNTPCHLLVNIRTGCIKRSLTSYPKDLISQLIPSVYLSPIYTVNQNRKQIVTAFPCSDSVFIENPVHSKIVKTQIKSRFFKFPQAYSLEENQDETMTVVNRSSHQFLVYDDKHLRYVYIHQLERDKGRPYNTNDPGDYFALPFSMQVLDDQFKPIGETAFYDHHLICSNLFFNHGDLYILNNNPRSASFKSSELPFVQFKFQSER